MSKFFCPFSYFDPRPHFILTPGALATLPPPRGGPLGLSLFFPAPSLVSALLVPPSYHVCSVVGDPDLGLGRHPPLPPNERAPRISDPPSHPPKAHSEVIRRYCLSRMGPVRCYTGEFPSGHINIIFD
jgi:hypothetical protein